MYNTISNMRLLRLLHTFEKCVNTFSTMNIQTKQQYGNFTLLKRLCSSNHLDKKSDLYRQLYAKILACGPITLADYMKEILIHPTAGYYTTKDIIGQKGDFITSPEISQLFGEVCNSYYLNEYVIYLLFRMLCFNDYIKEFT